MTELLTALWETSLTAVYVTAVVALLRLILKRRAPKRVLCLLWLVVFARLLVPVTPESPVSLVPPVLSDRASVGARIARPPLPERGADDAGGQWPPLQTNPGDAPVGADIILPPSTGTSALYAGDQCV